MTSRQPLATADTPLLDHPQQVLVFDFPASVLTPGLAYALGMTDRPTLPPVVWYLAICRRCGSDLTQPFRDETERDTWAAEHVTSTGHVVHLTVDGLDDLPGLHMSAVLQVNPDGPGFRFLCPADDCSPAAGPARWSEPRETAALAIAAWRTHGPAAA